MRPSVVVEDQVLPGEAIDVTTLGIGNRGGRNYQRDVAFELRGQGSGKYEGESRGAHG